MKKHGISREEHNIHEQQKFDSGKWKNTAGAQDSRKYDMKLMRYFFRDNIKSVLCLGARHGSEVLDLRQEFGSATGIDVVKSKYVYKVDAHDMCDVFTPNEFDFVYARHCLEHMVDPEVVLKNMREVAKAGCLITLPIFSEPYVSHCSLFEVTNLVRDNLDKPGKFFIDELTSNKAYSEDFNPLGSVDLKYFKVNKEKKEFTMIFVFVSKRWVPDYVDTRLHDST